MCDNAAQKITFPNQIFVTKCWKMYSSLSWESDKKENLLKIIKAAMSTKRNWRTEPGFTSLQRLTSRPYFSNRRIYWMMRRYQFGKFRNSVTLPNLKTHFRFWQRFQIREHYWYFFAVSKFSNDNGFKMVEKY